MKKFLQLALIAGLLVACSPRLASLPTDPGSSVPAAALAPTNTPRPPRPATPQPTATATPTRTPRPTATPNRPSETYRVRYGDTLASIAYRCGCAVEDILKLNSLSDGNALQAGQTLRLPVRPDSMGPATRLLPDSEFVYSPTSIGFDVARFARSHGGYLKDYTELVENRQRSGPEIVQLIAQRYSLHPRLLLTLLEDASGWVDNPSPTEEARQHPFGDKPTGAPGLFWSLSWVASQLNTGYYGWKGRGLNVLDFSDGTRIGLADGINAATAGLEYYLAQGASPAAWQEQIGPNGIMQTYRRLFGDPWAHAIEPLLPPDLEQPPLRLPWEEGQTWFLTGGPHGGWDPGSAWAALDFIPGGTDQGCYPAPEWATAAAPGLVVRSENGEVILDLDGDGYEQTGWVLLYLHIREDDRVPAGTRLGQGQRIGHPGCEGGYATATHLHFARRYNGEWLPAGGPIPLILSGWVTFEVADAEYDGGMSRDGQVRTACECRSEATNGLTSDNRAQPPNPDPLKPVLPISHWHRPSTALQCVQMTPAARLQSRRHRDPAWPGGCGGCWRPGAERNRLRPHEGGANDGGL